MAMPSKYGPHPANGTSAAQWGQRPPAARKTFNGYMSRGKPAGKEDTSAFGSPDPVNRDVDRWVAADATARDMATWNDALDGPVEDVPLVDPGGASNITPSGRFVSGSSVAPVARDGTVFEIPSNRVDDRFKGRINDSLRRKKSTEAERNVYNVNHAAGYVAAAKGGKARKKMKVRRDPAVFRSRKRK